MNSLINAGARDEVSVRQEKGSNRLGDKVNALEVDVTGKHSVGITDNPGAEQSNMLVMPVRLANGRFIPRNDEYPEYHPNAYWMVRIIGPERRGDKYYQFDKRGKLLAES